MFIDRISFDFLDNLFVKSGSSKSATTTPATMKKDYSFVGCNDDEDDNENNLEFDEKELETSVLKSGADQDTDSKKTAAATNTNKTDETKNNDKTDASKTDETNSETKTNADKTNETKGSTDSDDENTKETDEDTKQNEPYTENDGTFSFKGKKLYRNGQKYTGEFEGKLYKKGKLLKGTTNGLKYKDGVKLTGKSHGKWYVNGALADGEIDGIIYHNGKLLTGTATYTPYNDDGTLDTENTVERYYKKGVPSAGKFNGKRYGADGLPLNGTYKKHTYVNGVKQK